MKFPLPRPHQPFIGLALAAIVGIAAADFIEIPLPIVLALTTAGVALAVCRPGAWTAALLCALAFFEAHTLHHYHGEARQLASVLAHSGPRAVRATGIVWNEPAPPAAASKTTTTTARFILRVETLAREETQVPVDFLANVSWAGAMPAYGDRIAVFGSLANLRPTRNPGQFDFAKYQNRRGVYSEIRSEYADQCQIQSHGHGFAAQALAYRTSRWIQQQLREDLVDSPEISDLIASMVLGLRGETPEDMRALFQRTGTMHLFAVSGLNVAMLAAIVLTGLQMLGLRRELAILIVIPVLAAYALITGLTPSCVRATIMGSLILLGYLVDRPPLVLNSLGAAGFCILLADTEQLFSPGFQFSFVLVVTLVWLAGPLARPFRNAGHPDAFLPRELWSEWQRARVFFAGQFAAALGVSLAAWLGSALFTAGYFHLFSPSSIFANLIAVPLAFGVLVLGLASVLCAPVWQGGLILCNNANWFCATLLLKVLKVFALIPGGYMYVEMPRLSPPPACELTVLDLGEGGAAFLRAGGQDWLLDCGNDDGYKRLVLPYLRSRGVDRLDGLLLTHGDVSHIGGALEVVDDLAPERIVVSTVKDKSRTRVKLFEALNKRAVPKSLYERGDRIHLGDTLAFRVLYPPAGLRRNVADDKALVLLLEAEGRRILLMSDSGLNTERWLMENEPGLRCDLVVKGHQTKDFSGLPDFFAQLHVEAVICGALGFGHQPGELDPWEEQIKAQGVAVFRQDRTGAVQVEIRDGVLELRGFLGGQTFRSRAR